MHDAGTSLRHIVDARQFTRQWFEDVLFPSTADLQRTAPADFPQTLKNKRLFYLFYEPSTRTRVSFETAASLLGAIVTGMDSFEHRAEDERLEDRVRVLNAYPFDFLLLRYHQEGGASRAAAVANMSVINAGDGVGQHPTQALLDAYTLWLELGHLDGLRVALVGDLSYQRSTNSLAYVLSLFAGLKLYLVSPQLLTMREEVRDHLTRSGAQVTEVRDLRAIADDLDVVYLTRAHSERFEHAQRFQGESGTYAVDAEVLRHLPAGARVLHPLPRGPELSPELDGDPRIACFRQAANGLYVRMALLSLLASERD